MMIKHIFISIPNEGNIDEEEYIYSYFNALKKEFLFYIIPFYEQLNFNSKLDLDTVYIASDINTDTGLRELLDFINFINQYINLNRVYEFSIELQPANFSLEVLSKLKELNVNRMVIKIGSFNMKFRKLIYANEYNYMDDVLKKLKKLNFTNISCDLIYAFPNQTFNDLEDDLAKIIKYDFKHIYIEEYGEFLINTELNNNYYSFKESNENERAFYHHIRSYFSGKNYIQFEIFSFAKSLNYISRHNISYWLGNEYLGIGYKASSYLYNYRFNNSHRVDEYIRLNENLQSNIEIENINKNFLTNKHVFESARGYFHTLSDYTYQQQYDSLDEIEILNKKGNQVKERVLYKIKNKHYEYVEYIDEIERIKEFFLLRINLMQGINEINFKDLFGQAFPTKIKDKLKDLVAKNYLYHINNNYILTELGLDKVDYILEEIYYS